MLRFLSDVLHELAERFGHLVVALLSLMGLLHGVAIYAALQDANALPSGPGQWIVAVALPVLGVLAGLVVSLVFLRIVRGLSD